MKPLATRPFVAALALSFCALGAHAQASLVRVGTLIGTGAKLVAGDVTFSNFQAAIAPIFGLIPDGLGGLAVSTAVNPDGTVSISFTMIDPATGLPSLLRTGLFQSVSYDVTVTNPALVLGSVNQGFGPQTGIAFNILNHIEPSPAKLIQGGAGAFGNSTWQTIFVDEKLTDAFTPPAVLPGTGSRTGTLYTGSLYTAPFNATGSSLPGGLRTRMSLNSFFGISTDNHGMFIPEPGPFDGATVTLSLVPASTPNPVPARPCGRSIFRSPVSAR